MSCLVAPPSRYYHYNVMKKQREISHRFSINRKTLKSIFQINWWTLKMLLLMILCIHIDIKTKSIRKNINTIIVTSNFYHYNLTFGFLFQSFTTLICTSEMAVTVFDVHRLWSNIQTERKRGTLYFQLVVLCTVQFRLLFQMCIKYSQTNEI